MTERDGVPAPADAGSTAGPTLSFGFNLGKIPDQGEDSDPILRDGPGWSDISAVWENVVHHPSQAGGGLSEVDYGTIIDSIGNSV